MAKSAALLLGKQNAADFAFPSFFYKRHQFNRENKVFLIQTVLLHKLRPTAIRANPVLCIIKAKHHAARRFQFIIMPFTRQFFLRIYRCLKGKRLTGNCRQTELVIRRNDIVTIHMASILLRADIILMQILRLSMIQPMNGCPMLIPVAFRRASLS